MARVTLEAISKVFPGGAEAVHDVDLTAEDGEFLVIVGPSGSGKSTLLRLVAGLESTTEGRILLDGTDVTGMPPRERDLAMVFQNYALYPHKTVRENLAFGLRMRGASDEQTRVRVEEVARGLEIEALLDRKPVALSGGQQQRVALGRAIAREPRAFLLDEPLSNLDPALRVRTRTELARLQRRLGATVLYVTHDQEEALTLGHRVAVMRDGRVQQVAPPDVVYRQPANRFVAGFIGSPAMNFMRCSVQGDRGDPVLAGPGVRIGSLDPEDRGLLASSVGGPAGGGEASAEVDVGIRPHDLAIVAPGEGDLSGRVELLEELGREARLHVRRAQESPAHILIVASSEGRVRGSAANESAARRGSAAGIGETVHLRFRRNRLHFFRTGDGCRIEES